MKRASSRDVTGIINPAAGKIMNRGNLTGVGCLKFDDSLLILINKI